MQFEFKLFEDGKSGTIESEEWRQLAKFPRYDVSTLGRFRHRATGRILSGSENWNSYVHLTLTKDGKANTVMAHRMVAETFLEQPSPKHSDVNHKNKDRCDNRASNLEWVTRSYNSKHAHFTPTTFRYKLQKIKK